MPAVLVNERTGLPIATAVTIADSRRTRRRGLLGRSSLDRGAALLLTPCLAVHTAGMRFAIDVVFLNASGHVVRIVPALQPWRVAACRSARSVVELAAGALDEVSLAVGDRVHLAPTRTES